MADWAAGGVTTENELFKLEVPAQLGLTRPFAPSRSVDELDRWRAPVLHVPAGVEDAEQDEVVLTGTGSINWEMVSVSRSFWSVSWTACVSFIVLFILFIGVDDEELVVSVVFEVKDEFEVNVFIVSNELEEL